MQGNGCTLWVGVRVTCCVVQTLRTISTAHGLVERRRSASDWRVGYAHLNCRDLSWANAYSGGGVKITFQSSKHFQPGPPFLNARHPCGLVPCTAYDPPIDGTSCCRRYYHPRPFGSCPSPGCMYQHEAESSDAQRGKSFDVLRVQHSTELFPLVYFLVLKRPMFGAHDQTLDINPIHRFGALASLNPLRRLHNSLRVGPQFLTHLPDCKVSDTFATRRPVVLTNGQVQIRQQLRRTQQWQQQWQRVRPHRSYQQRHQPWSHVRPQFLRPIQSCESMEPHLEPSVQIQISTAVPFSAAIPVPTALSAAVPAAVPTAIPTIHTHSLSCWV